MSIFFIALMSCSTQKDNNGTADDCPTRDFSKKVDKYELQAKYFDCEPDWKTGLTILHKDKVVYKADSSMEFEFKEHTWPDFLKISDTRDQILLEVNDRPDTNFILCLTLDQDAVVKSEKFHLFQYPAKDFDNDGFQEYAGFPLTIEGYTNDSIYYNPILYIEKGSSGFTIDTVLTKQVNIKLYGEFKGLESSDRLYRKASVDTVDKYLNRARN